MSREGREKTNRMTDLNIWHMYSVDSYRYIIYVNGEQRNMRGNNQWRNRKGLGRGDKGNLGYRGWFFGMYA
jgi:hypothetical protein